MLKFARWYLNYGWKVIPSREKKAIVSGWGKGGNLTIDEGQIERWWGDEFKGANISAVTGRESNILVLDTDSEVAESRIQDILGDGFECPTVSTPGGGRHRYFKYEPGFSSRRYDDALDVKTDGGLVVVPPSKNSNGDYKWLTKIGLVHPPPLPSNIAQYLRNLHTVHQRLPIDRHVSLLFEEGSRDEALFHTAWCLSKGGMNDYNMGLVLEMLGERCEPPFPPKELKAKVNSAIQRLQNIERNLTQEIKMYALSTVGYFSSTDVYHCLLLSTRQERKMVSKVLGHMVEQGVLERNPKRNAVFRRIQRELEPIDLLGDDEGEIPFKWPLGEERLFGLMPKNIVIIAGTPDAGKTAYLLNCVALNMHQHEIHYFSSEMGRGEFKTRLGKYEGIRLDEWNFHPWERAEGFHDVIRPDAINIIDFLEIHEEFFAVGGLIKQIFDKLKTGVAILAIPEEPQRADSTGWV
jgi:hypothetical protein